MSEISYNLVRSAKRKSVAIVIDKDGNVEVRAPKWVKLSDIEKFVKAKEDWIRKKRAEILARKVNNKKSYVDGAVVQCLKQKYQLRIEVAGRSFAKVIAASSDDPDILPVLLIKTPYIDEEHVRIKVMNWASEVLKDYLAEAIDKYLPLVKREAEKRKKKVIPITKVTIKNVKSRWGSASTKGHLTFNNKLALSDMDTIDYVVVHELSHLVYMNHQAEFWSLVESIIPDHKSRRKYLKDEGSKWEY